MNKFALGATAVSLAMAAPANATVYNLDVFQTSLQSPLGTVEVLGEGTPTLTFNVTLNPGVFFQLTGSNRTAADAHDALWFDLTPYTGALTASGITQPTGNNYTDDGHFAVVGPGDPQTGNPLGQGFSSGFYGVQVYDTSVPTLNYYGGPLSFTLTGDGSPLDLFGHLYTDPNTQQSTTIYGGADLRQCSDTGCTTGPVGFTRQGTPTQQSVTPEPATWAMMLVGFGLVGAAMRRRNAHQAVRLTYA